MYLILDNVGKVYFQYIVSVEVILNINNFGVGLFSNQLDLFIISMKDYLNGSWEIWV